MPQRTTLQVLRDKRTEITHRISSCAERRKVHSCLDQIYNYITSMRRRPSGYAVIVLSRDSAADRFHTYQWDGANRLEIANALEQVALELRVSVLQDDDLKEECDPWAG